MKRILKYQALGELADAGSVLAYLNKRDK